MEEYDVLIIGAGPAGLWATVYGILNKMHICLIESTNELGGQPLTIYSQKYVNDIPGFIEIRAGDYGQYLVNQCLHYQKEFTLYKSTILLTIKSLENNWYECTLSNNVIIKTKYIIFAIGIGPYIPRTIEAKIQGNNEVYYIVRDLTQLINKKILVLGGGDSAVDWANLLVAHNITKDVKLIHHSNVFKALPKNLEQLEINNIEKYLDCDIVKMEPNLLTINNHTTNTTHQLPYDAIICMYGIAPNPVQLPSFDQNIELQANKFSVNMNFQTNVNHIYAIGQACIYPNRPNLIVVAQAEASIAIKTIANEIRKARLNK